VSVVVVPQGATSRHPPVVTLTLKELRSHAPKDAGTMEDSLEL
jgi:hypothetical protein